MVQKLRVRKGLVVLLLIAALGLAVAAFPGFFAPGSPSQQVTRDRLLPPLSTGTTGFTYYLGSDQLGRDVLSRLIYGTRTSLVISLSAVVIAGLIGCAIALYSGLRGGIADDVFMRLGDIQQAFPFLLLAIAIIGVLGPSLANVIIVLGVANWITFARVVRSEVFGLRALEFIEASRCSGASEWRVMFRHILPNTVPSIIVIATFTMASTILAEAGLSFLGLGVPPSIPSWGAMLADGREYVDTAWWLPVFPGLAITSFVLVINLLGDYLRDLLDPRTI